MGADIFSGVIKNPDEYIGKFIKKNKQPAGYKHLFYGGKSWQQ